MKELFSALLKAAEMESRLTGEPLDESVKQELTMWGAGIFRLVVMGEIKKGKSSFINAMLGEPELVPTDSDIATSTIYKIRYGSERGYKVHFEEASGKGPLSVNAADLRLFGTEAGNPGNEKQVRFIEVIYPSPILKSGIVIIDTPGLGGLFRGHKKITYEYVPRADAVFFVTDSVESPIGALELEYLNDVRAITPHLYFVQTKCNSVDEAACLARKANNLAILSRHLKCATEQIPYFLLDSKLRFAADRKNDLPKLERSGYPLLMSFIGNTLQGNQQQILAAKAIARMRPSLQHLKEILDSRKVLLQAQTQEQKDTLQEQLQEAEAALQDWQEREQPQILLRLQEGLQKLRLATMDTCNSCRPAGEIQFKFEELVHACPDMESLRECAVDIEEKLPEYCAQVAEMVRQDIRTGAEELLEGLVPMSAELAFGTEQAGEAGSAAGTRGLGGVAGRLPEYNLFDELRTGLYGGMAGVAIASIVGGIVGSVIPVVGTIIGSTVGLAIAGWWGGCKASEIKAQNDLKSAKQQVCAAVGQAMSSVYARLQSAVESMMVEINSRTSAAIQDALRQRRLELSRQLHELRRSSSSGMKEMEEKKAALAKENSLFAGILRTIESNRPSAK